MHKEYYNRNISHSALTTKINQIKEVIKQIPNQILNIAATQHHGPKGKNGEIVTFLNDEHEEEHGIKQGNRYALIWIDALGIPHETGASSNMIGWQKYETAIWTHPKGDRRVIAASDSVFPQMKGWIMNTTNDKTRTVELDQLSIKTMTYIFTQRKFKTPIAIEAWQGKVTKTIPFKEVFKLKGKICTPRDKATWLKLHRRALFTTGHMQDGSTCRACSEKENQKHLAECDVINDEYWSNIIGLLHDLGSEDPEHIVTFLLFGRISDKEVVDQETADVLFIAWRCLYAAITKSRIEQKQIDLAKAYKRCIQILISRVKAHASFWERWVHKAIHATRPHLIPEKHRENLLFQQEIMGEWSISNTLLDEAKRIGLH